MNQKTFQQNEALLQMAGRVAHIGAWVVKLPEEHVILSDELSAILEIQPDLSPTLEQVFNFYTPESREKIIEAFNACVRDGRPFDEELQVTTAKGRCIWVRVIGQAVRDNGNIITEVQGAFQDITERKRLEKQAFRLTVQLITALESITDAFFILDREWRFSYLNHEAERLLQRNRADLLGKIVWEEFKPAIGSIFEHQYHRAICDNVAVQFEEFYTPLNVWVEIHACPSDEGLAVYCRDITARKLAQDSIRESEERFESVAKATADAIWDWNLRSGSLWWNEGIQTLFGFSHEDLEPGSESWINRIHPQDKDRILRSIFEITHGQGQKWTEEYRFMRKDGSFVCVMDRGFVIRDPSGQAIRMVGAMTDLSERKQAEERHRADDLRIREQASLIDKAKDAIIVRGIDNRVRFWNKGAERLYGWKLEEALGRAVGDFLYDSPTHLREATRSVLENGEWSGEITVRRKDGRQLTVEGHWTLVLDDDGRPQSIFAINTDVTQRKADEQKIHRLAFHDPLTKLPNRMLLMERLQHALAETARSRRNGALLFIDLDNFKVLNDTLGHDKGDLLLQQVALRLTACMRDSDTVARFGGDEFVVMLEDLSENMHEAAGQAETIAEKILAAFHLPYQLSGHEYYSTPSIGVTLVNQGSNTADDLLKRADLAMYQAKTSGRNTIRFFDPVMQAAITKRVALEADLRQGARNNEFLLYFQPQVTNTKGVTGAEALIRWQQPQRGLVAPADFIPLAEETGIILPLGHWVLQAACQQLATWAGRPETDKLSLAVNVSARQFRHSDFVKEVLVLLDQTGADPRKLKIELTESLLVENVEDTIVKMCALKAEGVSFSLDDFGTGYSSLAYLKRLPLDQLKIDQSFVRDVLIDANDATIAQTIVALGQSLGLAVIAEGVETQAQHEFLVQHGCQAFQGYLFNRPLPIDEFDALVRQNRETANLDPHERT